MVSPRTRVVIWTRSAGRCQYPGCNKSLLGDFISGNEDANFGLIAHIVAEQPDGPRGDPVRSVSLADDPANLMLLCYAHHKLIDVDELPNYPESRLVAIKEAHEERIRIVTDIDADRGAHVLRYGARIGEHDSPIAFSKVRMAMLPDRYPIDGSSIVIRLAGSATPDNETEYWSHEPTNLRRQFQNQVAARIAAGEVHHLCVFALAPIPLLVELGRLLGDITPADVYQLHREPAGWKWPDDAAGITLCVRSGSGTKNEVALKLAISAEVNDDRIQRVLGSEVSIWSIEVQNPHNDVIRNKGDLKEFRTTMRRVYNELKAAHHSETVIHVFPAVPVSIAVELGRIWMPKADLPLLIYDETPGRGFVARLRVG